MADVTGRRPVSVRSVNCPTCGAATAVRTFGHAVNVVCQSCRSMLDADDAGVTILQQFTDAVRVRAADSARHQRQAARTSSVRSRRVPGSPDRSRRTCYQWREYLLFNPYQRISLPHRVRGTLESSCRRSRAAGAAVATPDERRARSYARADVPALPDGRRDDDLRAGRISVAGARRRARRRAPTTSPPPLMLSAEVNADKEVTWSLGRVRRAAPTIWTSLRAAGPAAAAGRHLRESAVAVSRRDRAACGGTRRCWSRSPRLLWLAHLASARSKQAFAQNFVFDPSARHSDASLVTPIFELDGRPSAVQHRDGDQPRQPVDVRRLRAHQRRDRTDRSTSGAKCRTTTATKTANRGPKGRATDAVTLPTRSARPLLPPNRDGRRSDGISRSGTGCTVVRDVPTSLWFLVALVLIVVPPILTSLARVDASSAAGGRKAITRRAEPSEDEDDDDQGVSRCTDCSSSA